MDRAPTSIEEGVVVVVQGGPEGSTPGLWVAREEEAAQETLDPGEDLDLENLDRDLENLDLDPDRDLENLDRGRDPGEDQDQDPDPFPAAPQHKSRR